MRKLDMPNGTPIELYDAIADVKRGVLRSSLSRLRPKILAAYGSYRLPSLVGLTPINLTKRSKTHLRHCYNVSTAPLRTTRQTLLQAADSVCPYCGIDTPETLDHYLPKEVFPEYSVCISNLVPMCCICNTRKGTAFSNGQRLFLHAYFDSIPVGALCLSASVEWDRDHPYFVFALRNHPALEDDVFDIIQEHVRRLDLLAWYGKKAGEEFDYGDMMAYVPSVDALGDLARKHSEKKARVDGPLSWRAALWRSVSSNPQVLRYLFDKNQQGT